MLIDYLSHVAREVTPGRIRESWEALRPEARREQALLEITGAVAELQAQRLDAPVDAELATRAHVLITHVPKTSRRPPCILLRSRAPIHPIRDKHVCGDWAIGAPANSILVVLIDSHRSSTGSRCKHHHEHDTHDQPEWAHVIDPLHLHDRSVRSWACWWRANVFARKWA